MVYLARLLLIIACWSFLSCGTNFYGFLVFTKDSSEVMVLEEARNDLDDEKYSDAINRLQELDETSNERSLLLASAYIGIAGLDLWSLIRQVIEDEDTPEGGGIDSVFNSVSAGMFGSDEERVGKRLGMRNAINALIAAPDQSDERIGNLGCFLAGLWSYPTIEDASETIAGLQSILTSVNDNITNTGDCGSTDNLTSDVGDIGVIASDIQLINQLIAGCTLFSTEGTSSNLNSLEQSLSKFLTNADVGCSAAACTGNAAVCAALEAGCVQSTFATDAVASDGDIATCEILYGCADSTLCF